jgi:two-component system chemotaxis response regulator CheB
MTRAGKETQMAMHARRTLRVLAADDSAVMGEVLRMVFALHASSGDKTLPPMELLGVEKDGIEALQAVRTLRPDVLLLDLEMPRLNGLGVLERLRVSSPALPVIMCSAHTGRGALATLDALAAGARDYVVKPAQQRDFAMALETLMQQLLPKVAVLAEAADPILPAGRSPALLAASPVLPAAEVHAKPVGLVVIGVSTGGPLALELMLPQLPRTLGVPVMIVQHMPGIFTGALAERLNRLCQMPVTQAQDGITLTRNSMLLAPGDTHMEVARGAGENLTVRLHHGAALQGCKPSVDYLFQSAARVCGGATLALVLTGMGADGLEGARAIRSAGGSVFAQDQESSAVWGMPGRVVHEGLASAVLPLNAMAGAIARRVMQTTVAPAKAAGRDSAHGML